MAELQLVISYKPKVLLPAYSAAYFAKWLFAVIIPTIWMVSLIALMVVPALRGALYSHIGLIFVFSGVAYGLFGVFIWLLTYPLQDHYIKLSKEGIVLPFLTARLRGQKSGFVWSEFSAASVADADDGSARLSLALASGQKLVLDTGAFEKSELEQLLLGVELWGTSIMRSPEFIDYQTSLQNEMKGVEVNYTRMWEEELSRRFKATSFLPLEPKHSLQNGRLTVQKQLAFGGLSAIYLVQRDANELFVLKEAVVPADADPEMRRLAEKHLAREAKILAGVSHPNIARVVDYFVEDSRTYLLLEFVNGQDLRQFVRQNGLQSASTVIQWALQLAQSLHYLHHQDPQIIHRDVSPDNIVLNNSGSVILIDFGASNEFIGTATGTLIGKQAYMAPEQLRGKATTRSDIYAFGACLFFLLTGRDPMPLSVCHPVNVVPDLPADLDALVAAMTEPEQDQRPADFSEVIDRLQALEINLQSAVQ
ncbi:MAG TPA: protein kinase [Drouetiella sp.]